MLRIMLFVYCSLLLELLFADDFGVCLFGLSLFVTLCVCCFGFGLFVTVRLLNLVVGG